VWEKIIEIEVQLRDEADVVSSARIDGNHRFGADLEVFARPDNAGIDCAGGLSLRAAVQRSFQCELHQRNQSTMGAGKCMSCTCDCR